MMFKKILQPFLISSARSYSSNPSWKILRLNHVAIATESIDKASAFYEKVLGAKVSLRSYTLY